MRRSRDDVGPQWREPAQGPATRRHHAAGRSCGSRMPRSRAVQIGPGRGKPWRVSGQDRGAPGRAEDRCPHDDAVAAALRGRRGRQQARARDFCRQRAVRPRRHVRGARRQPQVLPDGTRHSGKGRRDAADPILRWRGDRDGWARRRARRPDGCDAAMAGGAAMNIMHPALTDGSYDVARVREDFPILAMKVYGKPLIYLDNAASAQKPKAVLDRIQQAYTSEYANVHRGLHYLANAATEAYEGAREKVRAFLNAGRPEEIVFTRNATEAIRSEERR